MNIVLEKTSLTIRCITRFVILISNYQSYNVGTFNFTKISPFLKFKK
jgi:hypothetical protein